MSDKPQNLVGDNSDTLIEEPDHHNEYLVLMIVTVLVFVSTPIWCPLLLMLIRWQEDTEDRTLATTATSGVSPAVTSISEPYCSDSPVTSSIRIVFSRGPEGSLYITSEDGTQMCRLTDDSFSPQTPKWSRDGTQITFVSGRTRSEYNDIWLINQDGRNPVNLTNSRVPTVGYGSPVWSPDGTQIAFDSMDQRIDLCSDIFIIDVDGTNLRQLTFDPGCDQFPAWSPDGRQIAFSSDRTTDPNAASRLEFSEIYIMNVDGTGVQQVTDNRLWDGYPSWSPDGSQLAFTQEVTVSSTQIAIIHMDGTGYQSLMAGARPIWLLGGRRIAAIAPMRDGIKTIDILDGTIQQIPNTQATVSFDWWSAPQEQ